MPRTAPAPNIPAIPGMNPGVLVKAGGGAGGGSGAGRGKGKGGKKGANGGGSEENATGDGKNAEGSDGCGDPVCPVTGKMFLNILDFAFSGPMPLRFVRSYMSSSSRQRGDLGFGWTHNFGWRMKVSRRRVIVYDDAGRAQVMPLPPEGGPPTTNGFAWKLWTHKNGFELWCPKSEQRISFGRANASGFAWQVAETDRNGNKTLLQRDDLGRLQGIQDSGGRPYRVSTDPAGRILEISVATVASHSTWAVLIKYEYDINGDLRSVTDAEGNRNELFYDNHLIVEHRLACGLSYCYRYEGKGESARCVETWGEYIGRQDPALEHPLPVRPAKGPDTRPVKGIHYARLSYYDDFYTEVENGLGGIARYFGDAAGRVLKHVNEVGAVIEREFSDEHGSLVKESDPTGSLRIAEFDDEGNPTGFVGPSGLGVSTSVEVPDTVIVQDNRNGRIVTRTFDLRGNLTSVAHADGTMEQYTYDERGLLTTATDRSGHTTYYEHDAMGNLVETRSSLGVTRAEYDYLGRRTRLVGSRGEETLWRWDLLNRVTSKQYADGGTIAVEYDANSKPIRVIECGRVWTYGYGGLGWLTEVRGPDGFGMRFWYDVQGNRVLVENARGQTYRQHYDAASRPTRAITLEGLVLERELDAVGRIVQCRTPLARSSCAYGASGELTELAFADGETITLEHMFGTGLTKVDNGVVEVSTNYDGVGQPIRDQQGAYVTNIAWSGGRVARIESNTGVAIEQWRDPGGPSIFLVANSVNLHLHLPTADGYQNKLGSELVHERRRGPTGLLEYQALKRVGTAWAGSSPQEETLWWVRYEYGQDQYLRTEWHSDSKVVSYDVDAGGRIKRRRITLHGTLIDDEEISYDAAGSPRVANAVVDQLARVVGLGDEVFHYDAEGRLVRRVTSDGEWVYSWSMSGCLLKVEAPGHSVELDYDGRGRLCRKRVRVGRELTKQRAFVWANQVILHEVDELTGNSRTYLREDGSWEVLGHLDVVNGQATPYFYFLDAGSALERVTDAKGRDVYIANSTVFGEHRSPLAELDASLRFVNQHFDSDVGLVYNRFRWYDPRIGQYLSRDPIELDGNPNPRDYVPNPQRAIDPLGLAIALSSNSQPDGHGHPGRPSTPDADDNDAVATYLSQPGHWATNGTADVPGYVVADADERVGRNFRASTTRLVDQAGNTYGCHSCGRQRNEIEAQDGKFGHWRKDHQPPLNTVSAGEGVRSALGQSAGTVRIYPHCPRCSNTQGGLLSSRAASGSVAATAMNDRPEDAARQGDARR